MRWVVFLVFVAAALVFDSGLSEIARIEKLWDVRPSFCAVLAVFVALSAPRTAALWGCFVIGLLLDLCNPLTTGGGRVLYLVGPYTLGYVAGGGLVLQVRSMVFRRRPLTMGVMCFTCLLAVQAVVLVLLVVRSQSWYPGGTVHWTELSAWAELLKRFLTALYSGLAAVPVGWLLVRTTPLWGFQSMVHRAPALR